MRHDSNQQDQSDSVVNRRDVLKTAAGATVVGSLGTLSAGTASAVASMDAAFLTEDVDLNLYHHQDMAEYSSTDNRTYHVYQAVDPGGSSSTTDATDGDAYIVAYDHADGSVEGPVRVGLNPLNSNDTHGVPTLTVDGNGYIHVFFGNHGGWNTALSGSEYHAIQYARSANPYDIGSWIYPPDGTSGAGPLPTPQGTYTCATYDSQSDAVYVLYRAGNGSGNYPSHDHATLATSSDNGNTWTDVNNGILDFTDSPWVETCAYVCDLGAWAGRIHLTWMIAESDSHGQPRRHVYHAAYNPSTGNMETMSGTGLGTEVSHSEAETYCKVKDTTDIGLDDGGSVGGYNHAYDSSTDTAYIPVRYPVDSSTSQLRVLSYSGVSTQSGTWQESGQITTTSNPGSLEVHLRINDSGQLEVSDQGGKNGLWRKESGTWNHYDYAAGTSEIDKVQRPVQNGTDEFGWYGRTIGSQGGGSYRVTYALGFGQPSGAGAPATRAPQNLRVVDTSGTTATIDWDDGIAGPSALDFYRIYVDGVQHTDVTTLPNNDQPYPRTWADIDLGSSGTFDVEVSLVNNNAVESATSNTVTVNTGTTSQAPYGGTPWSIPGRIEAEDYDTGGEGVAYHDNDTTNNGGAYRSDGVDIETTGDSTGTYNVGYTNPDEWLEYTVDVGSSGTYDLDLRVARNPTGSSSMHVEMNGADVTGTVSIPNTGGWQTYQTVTVTDVSLSAGQHVMQIYFDGDGINLNYVEWSQVSTSSGLAVDVNGSVQTISESQFSGYGNGGTEDAGTATVIESGDAVNLTGNAWKSIPLNYTVTSDTVLEFELETPDAGELTSIGFDDDADQSTLFNGSDSIFHVAGSQSNPADMFDVQGTYSSPGPQTMSIDVGSYYTGSADRLAFIADDDADASSDVIFRNIRIYEDTGQSPYGGSVHAIPGKIEAENFDTGGEGVSYHDTTAGQEGSSTYRNDTDVDISDSGSGHAIGWIADGEWQEYTVDVSSAGTYDLDLRVASNSSGGATIHIEFDGTDETGAISLPNTGGWHTYQTVTETGITLDAGQQVMRVFVDDPAYNMDWLNWY